MPKNCGAPIATRVWIPTPPRTICVHTAVNQLPHVSRVHFSSLLGGDSKNFRRPALATMPLPPPTIHSFPFPRKKRRLRHIKRFSECMGNVSIAFGAHNTHRNSNIAREGGGDNGRGGKHGNPTPKGGAALQTRLESP